VDLRARGFGNHWSAGYTMPHLTFEKHCNVQWAGLFGDVHVSAYTYLVNGFFSNVRFGRYCSVGEAVQVGRGNHPLDRLTTYPLYAREHLQHLLGIELSSESVLTSKSGVFTSRGGGSLALLRQFSYRDKAVIRAQTPSVLRPRWSSRSGCR